jgi:tRNA (guanine-N7-)-methyltransferase
MATSKVNHQKLHIYDRPTSNPSYQLYNKKQKLSGSLLPQCAFYMKRKKRNCSHRVNFQGSLFCSSHTPENLLRLQQKSLADHEAKKITYNQTTNDDTNTSIKGSDASVVGKKRRRPRLSAPKRMVNPFSTFYSQQLNIPTSWTNIFGNPNLPMTIDVGCARGTMLDLLAEKHPERNWLGIEIRPKLVEEGNVRNQNKNNIHFISGNFSSIEAKRLIDSISTTTSAFIDYICFQFPDPWRKNKKQKRRRIIQKELVNTLTDCCSVGTRIYISTDVKDLALDNRALLEESSKLQLVVEKLDEKNMNKEINSSSSSSSTTTTNSSSTTTTNSSCSSSNSGSSCSSKQEGYLDEVGWLTKSVLSVPSERELVCEQDWRPVWRAAFTICENTKD